MKIVVAPDSFKGSLSSGEVGRIIKENLILEIPGVKVTVIPMADGGEGTLETLIFSTKGKIIDLNATGPYRELIKTSYGLLGDGETVVIETARVAGLTMVAEEKRNPLQATSFGIGEIIKNTIEAGYRSFIIGLGGSATNDGGLGMLQALGATFLDKDQKQVAPIGDSLQKIAFVDFSTLHPNLKACSIKIASDVENPLCGLDGASQIFGPQKGATANQVLALEKGMEHYAKMVEGVLHKKFQHFPGAGAAGGLGFGFLAIGAEILSGSQIVADATGLQEFIKEADWVITGEGKSDHQTTFGKAPFFVAKTAKGYGVDTILISGSLGEGHEKLLKYFTSCHAITQAPVSLADSIANAETYLSSTVRNIARLLYKASLKNTPK